MVFAGFCDRLRGRCKYEALTDMSDLGKHDMVSLKLARLEHKVNAVEMLLP